MRSPDNARASRVEPKGHTHPAGAQDEKSLRDALRLQTGPILVDAADAAALCGLSERTWWKLEATGQVPAAIRIGRRRLWCVEELRAWAWAGCPSRARWTETRATSLYPKWAGGWSPQSCPPVFLPGEPQSLRVNVRNGNPSQQRGPGFKAGNRSGRLPTARDSAEL